MENIFLIFAYLVGSISFAIIISKFFKLDDPRTYGSNNAGATNVLRTGNKKAAILTLLGDGLKGLFVVLVGQHYFLNMVDHHAYHLGLIACGGIFVVLGHIFPIFFNFKGGKGVATALGVILGFNVIVGLLVVASWLITFKISKVSSLSALIATILAPIYAFIMMGNNAYFGAVAVIGCCILFTHKQNIYRLVKKEETKITHNKQH